ncbi:MAG: Clp1/GlmU family protein, partial [Candidatus Bathyarchaeia archaeon]
MNRTVEGGRTLLVGGPASVTLLKGRVRVLGATIPTRRRIIVRKGKSLPLEAEEDSTFDLVLGAEASVEEVVGNTIPDSWKNGVMRVLSQSKPCTVMIMGDVDCGKTTFSTLLINHALSSQSKTAIIDADLGQSDIGPPTTMGLSLIKEPITELFSLEADKIFFVGATNPSRITDRVILGLGELKQRVGEMGVGLTVVNTDGWVRGEGAWSYKVRMVKELSPDFVVGIQQADELEGLLASVEEEGFEVLRLASSPALRRRDREERRGLREQGYRKFLGEPSLRLLPREWVRFEYTPLGVGGPPPPGRREELEEVFG